MTEAERGQVTATAAEVYEEFFIPALFGEWASRVAEEAALEPDQRVLDVGCGTGVLARDAYSRVGPGGSVVGLDPNEGMLRVARGREEAVEWRQGRAEALPFEADTFDAVLSQFSLMFFEDPAAGISEMARVLRPGGRATVAVWDGIDNCPGYAGLLGILGDLFGEPAAAALRAPFSFGDADRLGSLFGEAGLADAEIRTRSGTARFESIRSWMYTDVRGWTLSEQIDDAQFERLVDEAETRLAEFVGGDGRVTFDMSGHVVVAAT